MAGFLHCQDRTCKYFTTIYSAGSCLWSNCQVGPQLSRITWAEQKNSSRNLSLSSWRCHWKDYHSRDSYHLLASDWPTCPTDMISQVSGTWILQMLHLWVILVAPAFIMAAPVVHRKDCVPESSTLHGHLCNMGKREGPIKLTDIFLLPHPSEFLLLLLQQYFVYTKCATQSTHCP